MTVDLPKRLLVVGDDGTLEKESDVLFGEGFEVIPEPDGENALGYIQRHGLPHLLIVNLTLPDMDGLDLCRDVLQMADLPIITLSSHDRPGLAAEALQYADDYVRKPVDMHELIMRIRRILSRIENFSYAVGPQVKICDSITVDYVQRCVTVDGEQRQLTPTENSLLQVLLKHSGKVVAADTLIERVWRTGTTISDRNALRVHMHRLRTKIERDPDSPTVIQTERGIGYVFMGC